MTDRLLETRWGKWMLFVFGWALLSLLFAPEAYIYFLFGGNPIPWREALSLTLVNAVIALIFLPGIVWLTRRFPIERNNWPKALLVHVPACFVFAVSHSCLYYLTCYTVHDIGRPLFFRFHPNLLTYWAIVGFTEAVDYFRRYTERERQLAQAELLLLKSQLHPHFLFNTLHTISAMMHEDVKAADQMISRLSDLLRMTLDNIGKHEVPLKEEVVFIEKYLEIERIRFGERLGLSVDVQPDVLDALVPSMLLQPLVENSIRHGFGTRKHAGAITIQGCRDGDSLLLKVLDNGSGLPADVWNGQVGLGLANTRRRLEQLYPAGYQFELHNVPTGGTQVILHIPFHTSVPIVAGAETQSIAYEDPSADRRRRALGAKADRNPAQA